MPEDIQPNSVAERLGHLDASVASLLNDFTILRNDVSSIRDAVAKSKETNWSVILSGVLLTMAIYAAAIRPLEQEIIRQQQVLDSRGVTIEELRSRQQAVLSRLDSDERQIENIRTEGSPSTAQRLSVLESKLKNR